MLVFTFEGVGVGACATDGDGDGDAAPVAGIQATPLAPIPHPHLSLRSHVEADACLFLFLRFFRINKMFGISDLAFAIGDDCIADFVVSIQFLPIVQMVRNTPGLPKTFHLRSAVTRGRVRYLPRRVSPHVVAAAAAAVAVVVVVCCFHLIHCSPWSQRQTPIIL